MQLLDPLSPEGEAAIQFYLVAAEGGFIDLCFGLAAIAYRL